MDVSTDFTDISLSYASSVLPDINGLPSACGRSKKKASSVFKSDELSFDQNRLKFGSSRTFYQMLIIDEREENTNERTYPSSKVLIILKAVGPA
jgi:hypothetical protein